MAWRRRALLLLTMAQACSSRAGAGDAAVLLLLPPLQLLLLLLALLVVLGVGQWPQRYARLHPCQPHRLAFPLAVGRRRWPRSTAWMRWCPPSAALWRSLQLTPRHATPESALGVPQHALVLPAWYTLPLRVLGRSWAAGTSAHLIWMASLSDLRRRRGRGCTAAVTSSAADLTADPISDCGNRATST